MEGAGTLALEGTRHRPIVDLATDLIVGVEMRTAAAEPAAVSALVDTVVRELRAAGHPARSWWLAVRPMGLTAEVAVARGALTGALFSGPRWDLGRRPVVEVSEQALAAVLRGPLGELRPAPGVRLGLSDLGAGVLRPEELRHLPLAHVRVGIDGLELDDPADAYVLAELVAYAHGLGLEVLADGVETDEQVAFVADAGIGLALGYRWGSPGSVAKLVQTWARAS